MILRLGISASQRLQVGRYAFSSFIESYSAAKLPLKSTASAQTRPTKFHRDFSISTSPRLRSLSSSSSSPASVISPSPSPHKAVGATLTEESLAELFETPDWSVNELLAPANSNKQNEDSDNEGRITPAQLHHLLRLSALPLPSTAAEEADMIRTLEAQLHFVRAVQAVDTSGVEPLVAIRDETTINKSTRAVTLARLQHVLDREEQVGRYRRIVRKMQDPGKLGGEEQDTSTPANAPSSTAIRETKPVTDDCDASRDGGAALQDQHHWDPLERAPDKIGRFIRVNTKQR